ncbi:hypothetical protein E2C01_056913 [Portunus trituberculatus]|uniref:Endonuclease/exonuclease/phosphatase domain-containing protein n=1 Tax=Portunus trituberculatus TaxID=210409 RepID=A0A5B7GYP1_PORTR|nr:hypothetical protein [Portunus trituberculatus]
MATQQQASESPPWKRTRIVPRSDSSPDNNPECFDNSFNFFYINFYNIRGLRDLIFNLWNTTSPLLNLIFFSSSKQFSEANDSSPFSVLSYFLCSYFRSKAGCCVYVRNDLTCSRAHAHESSQISTIWLRHNSHSLTKFIGAVYFSLNSSNVEHILSLYSFAKISILGDFNVRHQLWLSSPFTDHPGELDFNFAILHDLEQLVQHHTRIPDRFGDMPNILDIFLT